MEMDPKKDLLYFLLVFAGIFLLWIFSGGPARYENAKPFLNPPGYGTSTDSSQ